VHGDAGISNFERASNYVAFGKKYEFSTGPYKFVLSALAHEDAGIYQFRMRIKLCCVW